MISKQPEKPIDRTAKALIRVTALIYCVGRNTHHFAGFCHVAAYINEETNVLCSVPLEAYLEASTKL